MLMSLHLQYLHHPLNLRHHLGHLFNHHQHRHLKYHLIPDLELPIQQLKDKRVHSYYPKDSKHIEELLGYRTLPLIFFLFLIILIKAPLKLITKHLH